MRLMYDSVDASAIPWNAEVVAGYVDGWYAWSAADWARFPNAVKVRISAVGATHLAHVFDVEVGCIWPPERVIPLVLAARAAGIDPTVYVNETNDWAPTRAAFDRAGVPHPHWWTANFNGQAVIPAGAVARQFAHPADPPGSAPSGPWETPGHYDLSAVVDYWPGVDGQGDDMSAEAEAKIADLHQAAVKTYELTGGAEGGVGFGEAIAEIRATVADIQDALQTDTGTGGEPVGRTAAEVEAKVDALAKSLATRLDGLERRLDELAAGAFPDVSALAKALVAEQHRLARAAAEPDTGPVG